MRRLTIIRHAETAFNRAGIAQGHIDVPLDEIGHAQAKELANTLVGLGLEYVFCSDLLRAKQTLDPLLQRISIPVEFTPLLRERKFGVFEGMVWAEVKTQFPEAYAGIQNMDTPDFVFGGCESHAQLERRVSQALTQIKACRQDHVAALTHGGTIRTFLKVLGFKELAQTVAIQNTAVTTVAFEGDQVKIETTTLYTKTDASIEGDTKLAV